MGAGTVPRETETATIKNKNAIRGVLVYLRTTESMSPPEEVNLVNLRVMRNLTAGGPFYGR